MAADPYQTWLESRFAQLKREEHSAAPEFSAMLRAARQRGPETAAFGRWRAVAAALLLGALGAWLAWAALGPGQPPSVARKDGMPVAQQSVRGECALVEWRSPTSVLLEPPGQWLPAQW